MERGIYLLSNLDENESVSSENRDPHPPLIATRYVKFLS